MSIIIEKHFTNNCFCSIVLSYALMTLVRLISLLKSLDTGDHGAQVHVVPHVYLSLISSYPKMISKIEKSSLIFDT